VHVRGLDEQLTAAILLLCPVVVAAQPAVMASARGEDRSKPLWSRQPLAVVSVDASAVRQLSEVDFGGTLVPAQWPIGIDETGPAVLQRVDVYAPGARIFAYLDDGVVELPRSSHRHFLGYARDRPEVRLMAWVDADGKAVGGVVSSPEGVFELVPIGRFKGGRGRIEMALEPAAGAVARDAPLWFCGLDEGPDATHSSDLAEPPLSLAKGLSSLHTAVIAVDTDNELMSLKFSNNTTAATNYIADLFAGMNVFYERDLNVRLLQGDTFLRVAPDPYTQSSTGNADYAKLDEFRDYWVSNYSSVDRALAAMLSGKQGSPRAASGIAFLDALCSSSIGYSFNQVFRDDYTYQDAGLVGHELGHNFGSHHTHCYSPPIDECWAREGGCYSGTESCPGGPGTLMSYCHMIGCGKTQDFHTRVISHLESDMSFEIGVCLFEEGPADTEPPVISDAIADPRIVAPGTNVAISATIVDEQSGVASASATIRDGGGSVVDTVPMSPVGGDTWQAVFDT
jgi:hypothetical protein